MQNDRLDKLRLELRRGALVLAVLHALDDEHYGYSLRKLMETQGLDIDEGTLYPLLRRLEQYGLLKSEWREEDGRKRRFYVTSPEGKTIRSALSEDWKNLDQALKNLVEVK